jgi:ATP-binding cassette subfamily C (CFTR/MRP) protein 10
MSTDTDRIINFCPSFHAFWSLPLQVILVFYLSKRRWFYLISISRQICQVGVTLYLLYSQIGLAFLAGLSFAVMLIPINRWIAVKVGKSSAELFTSIYVEIYYLNYYFIEIQHNTLCV